MGTKGLQGQPQSRLHCLWLGSTQLSYMNLQEILHNNKLSLINFFLLKLKP